MNNVKKTIVTREPSNPVLSAKDIPYASTLVYNAGVVKLDGKYVMIFRNEVGSEEEVKIYSTNLGLAYSDDGIKWEVEPEPVNFTIDDPDILKIYDPRLTMIEGRCYMCFAVDTKHGIRGGIAVTDDFKNFEVLTITAPDNRNMVLFPEKVNGRYVRLERPFPIYGKGGGDRFDIWISYSYDMKYWGDTQLLLGVENVPFANDKIGPAAPPIKTEKGWLTLFHAVDIDETRGKNGWTHWNKRYTAGIMLLDLENPNKIIGMYKEPLMIPEAPYHYEISGGYRNNVIFPGGMILEENGEVKIYYGASDTFECLATAHVDDLIKLCIE